MTEEKSASSGKNGTKSVKLLKNEGKKQKKRKLEQNYI